MNMNSIRRLIGILAIALGLLAGCMPPPVASVPQNIQPSPTLQGRVALGDFGRSIQATLTQVASASTVTLIDPTLGKAIASTVTDTNGNFSLSIPGFTPGANPYYLEATKGLNNAQANGNVATLRTIIRYSGGAWGSITGAGIVLGRSSTTLCAIAGLKAALLTSQQVTPSSLIGTVTVGSPDTFSGATNCSVSEYNAVLPLFDAVIGQDRDPLSAITYNVGTGQYAIAGAPGITSTSSLGGLLEGASVTLNGTGFDPSPGNDIVKFNGVPGVVTSATPTQLVVSMRGLTAGNITVQVGKLVSNGPAYTVGAFIVNDGTTAAGSDNTYQYSPLTQGAGYLKANWTSNPNATAYLVQVGSAKGASDIQATSSVGTATSYTANGLNLQGAWSGPTYYVTVTPVFSTGNGTSVMSNGVQIAEAVSWDGASTTGLRNDALGGYYGNFPSGSGKTQFYGSHYFETVNIAAGTTTYVSPFGAVDNLAEGASLNDLRVRSPKDGWLAIYANTITVAGSIDASGRGYGGGGGDAGAWAPHGHGGSGGLSGNGGDDGAGAGGTGAGAAGGGGADATGASKGTANGGNGGAFGGAGGGGIGGPVNGGSGAANGTGGSAGTYAGATTAGGVLPFGHGLGGPGDNAGGTGGAGYGAGGGGGVPGFGSCGAGAGGGGGGTGGNVATTNGFKCEGLGWAPGISTKTGTGQGGPAGHYMASADTTTDHSWILGSGGAGGDWNSGGSPVQYATGGGGGAGGGAIVLQATSLTVSGTLTAVGAAGGGGAGNDANGAGGGGSGSGGTIVLDGASLSFSGTANALGGSNGSASSGMAGGNGGDGGSSSTAGTFGAGSVKVFYHSLGVALPGNMASYAGRVYTASY